MAQQNSSEEVDLGTIFAKVRDGYHGLLISFYRGIQFLFRNWILILGIIIVGILIGYYLDNQKNTAKETTLLVQINFDSANYVYNAIDQLNMKIQENDTKFLEENGLLIDGMNAITSAEIQPIVNIMDILKNTTGNDGYIQAIFEQSKFEDDLLTSEIFIPEYKNHRIVISSNENNTDKVLSILLSYLNNNKILNKIKDATVENTKTIIEKNKNSISDIDSIMKVYGTPIENNFQPGQIYYNSYEVNNGNIHLLVQQKTSLLEENEELEIELIKYENIVELLNKPKLQIKKGILTNKIVIIPILFVILFIVLAFLKRFYLKAKRLSLSKE
ncbi:MAG TPA: hypothetical protein PKH16_00700 [Aequorivita sp.]|nr:hypothetical protein [Aequorivita sp.]|tara:strand:- start:86218 stop:87207 length:990 start_codon:yes stop_codon:yes gene_type:complete